VITRWLQLPLVEGSRFARLAASIAVCGFEHGVRQLSALGLTCRPQGHEAQRATVCAVRADGTLIAGVVRTCYAEMTVAQAECWARLRLDVDGPAASMVPRTVLRTGALPDWPTGPACCRSHPDHRRTRWTPNPVARPA
jgi:hypothetical protein